MLEFLIFALFSQIRSQSTPLTHLHYEPQTYISHIQPRAVAQKKPQNIKPVLQKTTNGAWLAIDSQSNQILLSHKAHESRPIASLTKLMTTYIILQEHELDEVVTVPLKASKTIGASMDLYAYEKITVRTLLEAVLISSANDAAEALALHNSGSERIFVEKMNQTAKELGLNSAEFFNPTGLDLLPPKGDEGAIYGNRMSAYDLSLLARRLLKEDFFRKTIQNPVFRGSSVDKKFYHTKKSTNQLLGSFLNIKGLKTGYTNLAGECFIALAQNSNSEIITVVLGSDDRFGDTKNLLSWIYDTFTWR